MLAILQCDTRFDSGNCSLAISRAANPRAPEATAEMSDRWKNRRSKHLWELLCGTADGCSLNLDLVLSFATLLSQQEANGRRSQELEKQEKKARKPKHRARRRQGATESHCTSSRTSRLKFLNHLKACFLPFAFSIRSYAV
jgi:hypothetical protein